MAARFPEESTLEDLYHQQQHLTNSDEGYDVTFADEQLDTNDMTCVICLFILREPHQAVPCGHRFCCGCIEKVRKQKGEKAPLLCPIDRLEITATFPDAGRKREILNLEVKCTNIESNSPSTSCNWVGELRKLQEHVEKQCDHTLIYCHLQCGVKVYRSNANFHLQNDCPKNLKDCKYSIIGCPFKGNDKRLSTHLSTGFDHHLFLQVLRQSEDVDAKNKSLDEMEMKFRTQVQDMEKRMIAQSEQMKNSFQKQIAELKQEHETKTDQMMAQSKSQEEIIKTLQNDVTEKSKRISSLEIFSVAPKCPFAYVIDNATEELQNARERNTILYSDSFYCLHGYKARLKIHLDGITGVPVTKGTHLAVYFQLLQGPFDDKLQWPMPFGFITLSLSINEGPKGIAKQKILRHTESDEVRQYFVKPVKRAGVHRGFRKFLALKELPEVIDNDKIKFEIDVTPC